MKNNIKFAKQIWIIIMIIILLAFGTDYAWKRFGKENIDEITHELLKIDILEEYGYDDVNYEEVDDLLSDSDKNIVESIYGKYVGKENYLDKIASILDKNEELSDTIEEEDMKTITSIYDKYLNEVK